MGGRGGARAASVDDEEKDGRGSVGALELVLDGGELRDELRGEIGLVDVCVVVRKVVARGTEGAHPHAVPEVNRALRVQHASTRTLAEDRLVRQRRRPVRNDFQRRIVTPWGDNATRRLEAAGWPRREAEAHAIALLLRVEVHGWYWWETQGLLTPADALARAPRPAYSHTQCSKWFDASPCAHRIEHRDFEHRDFRRGSTPILDTQIFSELCFTRVG